MRKALRYRLFGMGKMPEQMKAVASSAGVIVADEGLPVHNRVRSLRIPGAKVGGGVRTASGALVILPDRLLASVGSYVIVDTAFGADGEQELELGNDGVHLRFDVASAYDRGSGSIEIYYRLPLDDSVLSRLPALSCRVRVSHAFEALLRPWTGSYSSG